MVRSIVGRALALFARESRFTQAQEHILDHPAGLQQLRAVPGRGLTALGDSRMRALKI